MKTLIIILNKDNAENLRRCLISLENQTLKIGKDFNVLILDGDSKDNSRDVAKSFQVEFRVQKIIGGTGFARIEGCKYALEKGYDVVIWGDSENVYERDYVRKVLKGLERYDVVGGIPILNGTFFDHAFAWYHAIHLIIPKLYKLHIPGNNKAEKTWIYRKNMYPPSFRAEDYGFSISLLKKGIRLKQGVVDAKVQVSIPKTIGDVLSWQEARAKGVAQVMKHVGFCYDVLIWSSLIFLLATFMIISPFNLLPLIIYTLLLTFISILLSVKSKRFIRKFRLLYIVSPLVGLVIYSLYSMKALIYYLR